MKRDLSDVRPLDPAPESWARLQDGKLLATALESFYEEVFSDARLAPFFTGVTQKWVREKQYSFLQSLLLGNSSYFGFRPRNAHHWMVISDELFDYREEILARHLRAAGVDEDIVARIRAISEAYRKQIVKDAPRPRRIAGRELPLEGYEALELSVGAVCDGCGESIESGEHGYYHVRTGQLRCARCHDASTDQDSPATP